jgi:hypothetical protein
VTWTDAKPTPENLAHALYWLRKIVEWEVRYGSAVCDATGRRRLMEIVDAAKDGPK